MRELIQGSSNVGKSACCLTIDSRHSSFLTRPLLFYRREEKLDNRLTQLGKTGNQILGNMAINHAENQGRFDGLDGTLNEIKTLLSGKKDMSNRPIMTPLTDNHIREFSLDAPPREVSVSSGLSSQRSRGTIGSHDAIENSKLRRNLNETQCKLKASDQQNRELRLRERSLKQQMSSMVINEKENTIRNGQPVKEEVSVANKVAAVGHKKRLTLGRLQKEKENQGKIGGSNVFP